MLVNAAEKTRRLGLGLTGEVLEDGLTELVGGLLQVLQVLLHKTVGRATQDGLLEDRLFGDEAVNQRANVLSERSDGGSDLLLVGGLEVRGLAGDIGALVDGLAEVRGLALELQSGTGGLRALVEVAQGGIEGVNIVGDGFEARDDGRGTRVRACGQAEYALAEGENANEEGASSDHFDW